MSTGVNSSAPRHAWELGGWVADSPQTNAHNRKNGGNRYNTRNCEISIVMKYSCLISNTENSYEL